MGLTVGLLRPSGALIPGMPLSGPSPPTEAPTPTPGSPPPAEPCSHHCGRSEGWAGLSCSEPVGPGPRVVVAVLATLTPPPAASPSLPSPPRARRSRGALTTCNPGTISTAWAGPGPEGAAPARRLLTPTASASRTRAAPSCSERQTGRSRGKDWDRAATQGRDRDGDSTLG